MKKNQAVLLMNQDDFINEVQKMLSQHKAEIIKALSKRNDEAFTREEVAKYLKVSPQTILNWSKQGILNPVFIGSRVYYKTKEVNNLLNGKTIESEKKEIILKKSEILKIVIHWYNSNKSLKLTDNRGNEFKDVLLFLISSLREMDLNKIETINI
jgi:hypothetical protein